MHIFENIRIGIICIPHEQSPVPTLLYQRQIQRSQVIVSHNSSLLLHVGSLQRLKVTEHQLHGPVTSIILFGQRQKTLLTHPFLTLFQEFLGRHAPDYTIENLTILVQIQKGRESSNFIMILKVNTFSFLHVYFHIDEVRIKIVTHSRVSKDIPGHHLAGSTPDSVTIHENWLVLLFGQCQNFAPATLCKLDSPRGQRLLSQIQELVALHETTSGKDQLTITIYKKIGGVGKCIVPLCQ